MRRPTVIFALGGLLVFGGATWTVFADGGWGGVVLTVVGTAIWVALPGRDDHESFNA